MENVKNAVILNNTVTIYHGAREVGGHWIFELWTIWFLLGTWI